MSQNHTETENLVYQFETHTETENLVYQFETPFLALVMLPKELLQALNCTLVYLGSLSIQYPLLNWNLIASHEITDTMALLYPCCTYVRGVKTLKM